MVDGVAFDGKGETLATLSPAMPMTDNRKKERKADDAHVERVRIVAHRIWCNGLWSPMAPDAVGHGEMLVAFSECLFLPRKVSGRGFPLWLLKDIETGA